MPHFFRRLWSAMFASRPVASAPSTVETRLDPFGAPNKAEFYPLQTNIASGDGRFVFRLGAAEEIYVIPSRLLGAADIAGAHTYVGVTGAPASRVEVTLRPSGVSAVQSLIASSGPDHPIGLVWMNEVVSVHPASAFIAPGPIVIAECQDDMFAGQLAIAMR